MKITVSQIAKIIGGIVEGPDLVINSIDGIREANEGSLSFIAKKEYENYLYKTKAGCLLVNHDFLADKPVKCTLIRTENAYMGIVTLMKYLEVKAKGEVVYEISPLASISPKAKIAQEVGIGSYCHIEEGAVIAKNVMIYPQVYIGKNVKIGEGTVIYPGVKIMQDCEIGTRCTILAGAVVGSDGFGSLKGPDGKRYMIPHIGKVIIEDDVCIGANTTIDRATFNSTIIRKGVLLDNLIQVGHNVEIGKNTAIAAQTGIAGSAVIGDDCMIGGQVGFAGHIKVASGTQVGGQSGVQSSVLKPNTTLNSTPAYEYKQSLRTAVIIRRLPDLEKEIYKLKSIIEEIKGTNYNPSNK